MEKGGFQMVTIVDAEEAASLPQIKAVSGFARECEPRPAIGIEPALLKKR